MLTYSLLSPRLNLSASKSYYFLLLILGFWLLSIKQRQHGGIDDLDVFFNAGKRLLQQEDIYGPPHFYNLKYFKECLKSQGSNQKTERVYE